VGEDDEAVEPIDLHKVILAQSLSNSVGDSGGGGGGGGLKMVLKEGPVNILRMTGFPKRLAKKQVKCLSPYLVSSVECNHRSGWY
jgi:hypothetical protein